MSTFADRRPVNEPVPEPGEKTGLGKVGTLEQP